jgi:inner membrane protein
MDPISHLIIGVGLAALSGEPFSWTNPIFLGSALGAVAPDLDIVLQLKGDMVYLKHHRGFSHSLPGIMLSSSLITGLLSLVYPEWSLVTLFMWIFLGALSHSFFDVCNSYGAQLLGPWCSKKFTLNLVQIFDPILLAFFAAMAWVTPNSKVGKGFVVLALLGYMGFRWLMREILRSRVGRCYREEKITNLILLPSVAGVFSWDYLLETEKGNLVGQVHLFKPGLKVIKELTKEQPNEAIGIALKSVIGSVFREFTPYFHVSYYMDGTKHIVRFFDLRYLIKREFMHSATVILDQQQELVETIFHPYHQKRNIRI